MAAGAWLAKYRYIFIPFTMTLLGISFYKTYWGGCVTPRRNRVILWVTAGVSFSLTIYSLFK